MVDYFRTLEPTVVAALIGAVSGWIVGVLFPLIFSWIEARRFSRKIRRAFAAEIRSVATATKDAGFSELTDELLLKAKNNESFEVPELFVSELEYDPIFSANTENIGLLGPELASKVLVFYKRIRLNRFRYLTFQGKLIGHENRDDFVEMVKFLKHGIEQVLSSEELVSELER